VTDDASYPPRCFYCGALILKDPAFNWRGAGGAVWLHPPCASDLVERRPRVG
jgi:hypothetical protein